MNPSASVSAPPKVSAPVALLLSHFAAALAKTKNSRSAPAAVLVAVALACLNLSSGLVGVVVVWLAWRFDVIGVCRRVAPGLVPFLSRQLARAQFSSRRNISCHFEAMDLAPNLEEVVAAGATDSLARVLFVGERGVGKSSLIRALREHHRRRAAKALARGPSPASPSDVLTDCLERTGSVSSVARTDSASSSDSSAASDGGASDSELSRTDSTMSLGGASSVAGSDGGSSTSATAVEAGGAARRSPSSVMRQLPPVPGAAAGASSAIEVAVVVWEAVSSEDLKAYARRMRGAVARALGRSVPVVVVCTKTDVAPCPLPQMDAALTENADVVAVSASRGTNTGELWGLIERHLQSVELAQRKLGE